MWKHLLYPCESMASWQLTALLECPVTYLFSLVSTWHHFYCSFTYFVVFFSFSLSPPSSLPALLHPFSLSLSLSAIVSPFRVHLTSKLPIQTAKNCSRTTCKLNSLSPAFSSFLTLPPLTSCSRSSSLSLSHYLSLTIFPSLCLSLGSLCSSPPSLPSPSALSFHCIIPSNVSNTATSCCHSIHFEHKEKTKQYNASNHYSATPLECLW